MYIQYVPEVSLTGFLQDSIKKIHKDQFLKALVFSFLKNNLKRY